MKVDDPRTPLSTAVTPTTDERDQRTSGPRRPAQGDHVALSNDVQLARAAVRAASLSDETRPGAVERAKALLDNGTLGTDVNRLADQIIDSLLDSYDPSP